MHSCKNKMMSYPDQPVLRLVLLSILNRVIDQTKASRFASSKVGSELEHKDGIWIFHFIHPCQFFFQLSLKYQYRQVSNEKLQNHKNLYKG